MVYKRIVEAFQHVMCKFFQFRFRQVQGFHQFLEHYLMNKLAHYRMLASIAHDIDTRQVSYRRKHGVRSVQQSHFPFVVRCFRRHKEHIQSGFVGREFGSYFLRCFNYPQMENFGLHHHVVIVLQFFFDSRNILARESRYDTVNQCSIHTTSLFKPLLEVISQVPKLNILIDGFFQLVSVQENQFTGEDNQSL